MSIVLTVPVVVTSANGIAVHITGIGARIATGIRGRARGFSTGVF
jgi:hypothetical protein